MRSPSPSVSFIPGRGGPLVPPLLEDFPPCIRSVVSAFVWSQVLMRGRREQFLVLAELEVLLLVVVHRGS